MSKKTYLIILALCVLLASCASNAPKTAPVEASVEELPVTAPVQGLSVISADETPVLNFAGESGARVLMMGDTMCFNVKTPDGWQLDYDFARWAGYDIGFLPEDAYGSDGVSIQFYILGYFEENFHQSYADFIEADMQNFILQGCDVVCQDVDFTPDTATGMIDYGMCEMYGLPESAVEMLYCVETENANAVLFCAAKGDPEEAEIEKLKKAFIELCRTAEVNAPMILPSGLFE